MPSAETIHPLIVEGCFITAAGLSSYTGYRGGELKLVDFDENALQVLLHTLEGNKFLWF